MGAGAVQAFPGRRKCQVPGEGGFGQALARLDVRLSRGIQAGEKMTYSYLVPIVLHKGEADVDQIPVCSFVLQWG